MVTLLDGWCALNTAFGGPLLALVTLGGAITAGKTLISFPKKSDSGTEADKIRKNRFRNWILWLGIVVVALLLVDVFLYVYAYSQIRKAEKVCVDTLTDAGYQALDLFFGLCGVTIVAGSLYAYLLNKLKEQS